MLTASLMPAAFGVAMLTASLPVSFGRVIATDNLLVAAVDLSLVEDIWVELTLVRLAFLLAARLLIRDFFSIDIVAAP